LVMFDIDQPRFMGLWMPTMAPVLCGEPIKAERVMVNGKWVIERGQVKGIDLADLAQSASRERQRLMERFA
ncbi:MAG: amidohydrolase, partial [Pseudomonadales bacterium]